MAGGFFVMQVSIGNGQPSRTLKLAAIAALCLTPAACGWFVSDGWDGWVYPDGSNLAYSISLTGFESFEACQEAALATIRALDDPGRADYECGRGCRWEQQIENNVCKETRK